MMQRLKLKLIKEEEGGLVLLQMMALAVTALS